MFDTKHEDSNTFFCKKSFGKSRKYVFPISGRKWGQIRKASLSRQLNQGGDHNNWRASGSELSSGCKATYNWQFCPIVRENGYQRDRTRWMAP